VLLAPAGEQLLCPGAVTVTNAGNVRLANISALGHLVCVAAELLPGASVQCDAKRTVSDYDFEQGASQLSAMVRADAHGTNQSMVSRSVKETAPVAVKMSLKAYLLLEGPVLITAAGTLLYVFQQQDQHLAYTVQHGINPTTCCDCASSSMPADSGTRLCNCT
jgi:hypothetical protein